MNIHIKNMVCPRCIMAVREILKETGLHPLSVELGEAEIQENELTPEQNEQLNRKLEEVGFERIEDRNKQLVDRIKTLIIEKIHHDTLEQGFNWSKWITENVHHNYRFLSHLFSGLEGITIEQYLIRQKIEKVKELIAYQQMNFSEIAYSMGYSSPAHMTNQFRKVTGMTPGEFKKMRKPTRRTIDDINSDLSSGVEGSGF